MRVRLGFTVVGKRAREHWPVLALMVVAAVVAVVVHSRLYHWYTWPNRDEPVYVLQARTLLDGHLTLPRYPHLPFFQPWLTGVHDGRLVFQFAPGWPALLAATQWLFGSMLVALPAVAASSVLAVYLVALETTRERWTALIAAALAVATPLVILQSGLRLSYLVSFALGAFATFAVLRGTRTERRGWIAAGGALLGAVFLTRSYDALLWGLPLVAYLVAVPRRGRRVRSVGVLALGAAPLTLLMLAFNTNVGGSPLEFPITAGYRGNGLGFGRRGIMPGLPIDFHFADAVEGVAQYFRNSPPWLFGGLVGVGLMLAGAVLLRRRATTWLLLSYVITFGVGYGFYWNISRWRSVPVEGPLYFLPMLLAVVILGAVALVECWRWNRIVVTAVVVASLLVSVPAMVEHVHDNTALSVTPFAAQVHAVRAFHAPHSLVFVDTTYARYLLTGTPNAENGPTLDGDVVFAADLGPRVARLVGHTTRTPYRLVSTVDQVGTTARRGARVEELTAARGERMTVTAHVVNRGDQKTVTAFLRTGHRTWATVVDRDSVRGRTYDVQWTVTAPGLATDGPTPAPRGSWLVVGARFGPRAADPRDANRADVSTAQFAAWTSNRSMTVLTPPSRRSILTVGGEQRLRLELPSTNLDVSVAAG